MFVLYHIWVNCKTSSLARCSIRQYTLTCSFAISLLPLNLLYLLCSLPQSTKKTITEIAFSYGFNHLSYFSKLFIKNFVCTPREYCNNKNM